MVLLPGCLYSHIKLNQLLFRLMPFQFANHSLPFQPFIPSQLIHDGFVPEADHSCSAMEGPNYGGWYSNVCPCPLVCQLINLGLDQRTTIVEALVFPGPWR